MPESIFENFEICPTYGARCPLRLKKKTESNVVNCSFHFVLFFYFTSSMFTSPFIKQTWSLSYHVRSLKANAFSIRGLCIDGNWLT